jgi:hypothetical protein
MCEFKHSQPQHSFTCKVHSAVNFFITRMTVVGLLCRTHADCVRPTVIGRYSA